MLGLVYGKKNRPDNSFTLECCKLALKHFPFCINALLLQSEPCLVKYSLKKNKDKSNSFQKLERHFF